MSILQQSPSTAVAPREPAVSTNWLASLLVVATVIELTILRIGTRTVIHIPNIESVAGPYRVAAAAGRLAFFCAVVLLAGLLVSLIAERYRANDFYTAAALTVFLLAAAGARSGLIASDWAAPIVAIVVAATAATAVRRRTQPHALVIALFVVGYLLLAFQSIAQPGVSGDLVETVGAGNWVRVAELLVVAAALVAWPLWQRSSGQRWWIGGRLGWAGAVAGVLVTVALAGNGSTTTVLMLWNFGLTGTLPAVLYGLATTSVVLTIGTLRRASETRLAIALALLVLGGVGLTSTYQSGLTVAGLALLLPTEQLVRRPHLGARLLGRSASFEAPESHRDPQYLIDSRLEPGGIRWKVDHPRHSPAPQPNLP